MKIDWVRLNNNFNSWTLDTPKVGFRIFSKILHPRDLNSRRTLHVGSATKALEYEGPRDKGPLAARHASEAAPLAPDGGCGSAAAAAAYVARRRAAEALQQRAAAVHAREAVPFLHSPASSIAAAALLTGGAGGGAADSKFGHNSAFSRDLQIDAFVTLRR